MEGNGDLEKVAESASGSSLAMMETSEDGASSKVEVAESASGSSLAMMETSEDGASSNVEVAESASGSSLAMMETSEDGASSKVEVAESASGSILAMMETSEDGASRKAATPGPSGAVYQPKGPSVITSLYDGHTYMDFDIAQYTPKITSRTKPPTGALLAFKPQYAEIRDKWEVRCKEKKRVLMITGGPGLGKAALVEALYKPDGDKALFVGEKEDLKKYDEKKHSVIIWNNFKTEGFTVTELKIFLSIGIVHSHVRLISGVIRIAPSCFRVLIVNQSIDEIMLDICSMDNGMGVKNCRNCYTLGENGEKEVTWFGNQVGGCFQRVLFVPILETVYQTEPVGESAGQIEQGPEGNIEETGTGYSEEEAKAEKARRQRERNNERQNRYRRKKREEKKRQEELRRNKDRESGLVDESVDDQVPLERALIEEADKPGDLELMPPPEKRSDVQNVQDLNVKIYNLRK